MQVSLICPVYNEIEHLQKIILFFESTTITEKELIFIDGGSNDGSRKMIESAANKNSSIHFLDNPRKYVPFALNKAISAARGKYIIRVDAHTDYHPNYVNQVLNSFSANQADITGGPMRIAKGTDLQQAIGYATSTSFGVGNSSFHFENYSGLADSVYLGAWKKEIFERTGLFDESLIRNQDDEFHYRAKQMGISIYQDPSITCWYYPRNSVAGLFKQYFQYGYYKPVVLKKIPAAFRMRHLVPACFVLYILLLPFCTMIFSFYAFIPLACYLITSLYFSFRSPYNWHQCMRILVVYAILHCSYGLGFLTGMVRLCTKK
jgi:glycosyltransferase involved in cell wall biosynthesis